MEVALTGRPVNSSDVDYLGQPKGLWVLAGTELWDRISYHGMQALLVLYMVQALLLPKHVEHVAGMAAFRSAIESLTGPLSVQAFAAQTFGLYVGLIYFTPVIGGWIGDRFTGRRLAVTFGALLMTAGHFAMAFDKSFLLALLLLILGAGLMRGNLSPQIKSLYADNDRREGDAFQYYWAAVNLGAFIAPLVSGLLAAIYGWHAGFGFAGFGMLIGLGVYLAGQKHLPPDSRRAAAIERDALTANEKRSIIGLLLTWPISVLFWTAQSQVWNVYNLWVHDHIRLTVGSFQVPVPWLQALDGLAPVMFMPPCLLLWRWQASRGREPRDLTKMAIGCFLFAIATAWLAEASWVSGADGRAPLIWAVIFHLISNIGAVFFVPTVVALFAAKAPPSLRGMMLGIDTTSTFAASIISGRLGGLYETMTSQNFWLLHAAIVGAGGLILLVLARPIRRLLGV